MEDVEFADRLRRQEKARVEGNNLHKIDLKAMLMKAHARWEATEGNGDDASESDLQIERSNLHEKV